MNLGSTPNVDRLFFAFLLACPTVFAVGTAPVHADPPEQTEIAKLLPSPGIELERFGTAVSLDGDTLVVGAPNYVPEPTGPGSVYLFHRDPQGNSTEFANLVVSDAACGDGFGEAVSIDGDTIITVRSDSGDPALCIIDCEWVFELRGFHFHSGETDQAVVSGERMTPWLRAR